MNLVKADIVDLHKRGKIVCVTTNGFINKSNRAVMGRGNALAMATYYPKLPSNLAAHIKQNGHIVGAIGKGIISFPTKPISGNYDQVLDKMKNMYKSDQVIPGYHCKSDLKLIEKSMDQLNEFIEKFNLEEVYLPLPGCSNGELSFKEVEPIIEKANMEIIFVHL